MLAAALALGAALSWGVSDFLGGLRSRALPLLSVLLVSQTTALVLLVLNVAVRGAAPAAGLGSLGWAAAAGGAEAVGVAALYRGLAVGTMSIVAPVAATAPVVAVLAGVATGEALGPVQVLGIGGAVAGVTVTSVPRREDRDGDEPVRAATADRTAAPDTAPSPPTTGSSTADRTTAPDAAPSGRSVIYGLLTAAGFGTFLFAMDRASDGDISWALVVARLTAVSLVAATALASRARPATGTRHLPALVTIGVLLVSADALYATASTLDLVSVAAVVASLHPVVTIGLARVYLDERLARVQQVGVAASLLGVLTLSVA